MGKPFDVELAHVVDTLAWAKSLDVSALADFLDQAHGSPLMAVGAGGSFTAAEMARLLFESRGDFGSAHTPLSFLQSNSDLHEANILIFTAGGGNRDVLAVFQAAVEREARAIHVVCGSSGAKIESRIASCPRATLSSLPIPTGKDGYLATNSLVAFAAIAIRASRHALPPLVEASRIMAEDTPRQWLDSNAPAGCFYPTVYADWAKPAAVDLESKFSEAGLGGVLPADYRHFAHGRHNWLDKRKVDSTVIALITPSSLPIAQKTLSLFPKEVRVIEMETRTPGPAGGLELILWILKYTAHVGKQRGIDPGRPGVPLFGSRIYHLGPVIHARSRHSGQGQVRHAAISRKAAARGTLNDEEDWKGIERALAAFVRRLERAEFGALVVDFDGTITRPACAQDPLASPVAAFLSRLLANEVPIFFATGRGDSIHPILKGAFRRSSWGKIFISHYNGALTLPLSESDRFAERNLLHHPEMDRILEIIKRNEFLSRSATVSHKPCQIRLKPSKGAGLRSTTVVLRDLVAKHAGTTLRVVQSTHSMDVIPIGQTKLACVKFAESWLQPSQSALAIGDCGAAPGNDFDLLTHPLSLSVDAVSTDLDSCWNILPQGISASAGLVRYGSWMRVLKGRFRISIPKEDSHE